MERELFEELADEQESYSDDSLFNITSYGNDINLRQIVEMYNDGDIVKPELQRKYVWTKNEASRFIDSILLGLPVPSIFLAKSSDKKLLIVDGYQRIMTINDYMRGFFSGDEKEFHLSNTDNIYKDWRGLSYSELMESQKRQLRTSTIHAIIFEQKKPEDDTAMYQIFERLNTGGRVLRPQEIRNCVYHGEYNSMLLDLNKEPIWRVILGSQREDQRMSDVEMILRFFAFLDFPNQPEIKQHQINLSKYLNDFMGRKKYLSTDQLVLDKEIFISVLGFLYETIGLMAFRTFSVKNGNKVWARKINPVVFDALCTATYYSRSKIDLTRFGKGELLENYVSLLQDVEFIDVTKQRTTNVESIIKRTVLAAKKVFGVQLDGYSVPKQIK